MYKHYMAGPTKPNAKGAAKVQAGAACGAIMRAGDMYADPAPGLRGVACATCPACQQARPQRPSATPWQAIAPKPVQAAPARPVPYRVQALAARLARYGR
jgi:hypothetical protein